MLSNPYRDGNKKAFFDTFHFTAFVRDELINFVLYCMV
jgi:hypothetical protein